MVAEDYLEEPSFWTSRRPPKSDALAEVHRRVGKEVAHLTYRRLDVAGGHPWKFVDLAEEIEKVYKLFLDAAPRERTGSAWEMYSHGGEVFYKGKWISGWRVREGGTFMARGSEPPGPPLRKKNEE